MGCRVGLNLAMPSFGSEAGGRSLRVSEYVCMCVCLGLVVCGRAVGRMKYVQVGMDGFVMSVGSVEQAGNIG